MPYSKVERSANGFFTQIIPGYCGVLKSFPHIPKKEQHCRYQNHWKHQNRAISRYNEIQELAPFEPILHPIFHFFTSS